MRWTTVCWTPTARRGNCTRQGLPLKTRFAKNGSLPFPVHILGNEPFFVEMLQLAQSCFLRCAGTNATRSNRSWRRRRRAFASFEALIVFRGAFDGAAFGKIGEHLRALIVMRIAGCGTCRLTEF